MMTWYKMDREGTRANPEGYWVSQRILDMFSRDLETFSNMPNKLFDWNICAICFIIRKERYICFVIIMEITYPILCWPNGKILPIASSEYLLGPYFYPTDSKNPKFRQGPMEYISPDNKKKHGSILQGFLWPSMADNLNGPWDHVSRYTFYSHRNQIYVGQRG